MIKYEQAKLAFAKAIYDLLLKSEVVEYFSVSEIAKQAGIAVGGALYGRMLSLSAEEDDVFSSTEDQGEVFWTLGREGFDLVEAHLASLDYLSDVAPASDRIVRFNHNAPDSQKVASLIEEVREAVRAANGPEIEEQERERVFSALSVAQEVWRSANFRLIQLKVGVLIAAQDAALILADTAKGVAAALLVDAVKAFAKNHLQVDLDSI